MIRPNFCTVVMPDEYDYVAQCEASIKEANKFHGGFDIHEDCPPPYFPLDVGKFAGLVLEVQALKARLKEAEAFIPTLLESLIDETCARHGVPREFIVENMESVRRAAAWLKEAK